MKPFRNFDLSMRCHFGGGGQKPPPPPPPPPTKADAAQKIGSSASTNQKRQGIGSTILTMASQSQDSVVKKSLLGS